MTQDTTNPRLLNYCRWHDKPPVTDSFDWRYPIWNSNMIRKHLAAVPSNSIATGTYPTFLDHAAYDAWLTEQVDKHVASFLRCDMSCCAW